MNSANQNDDQNLKSKIQVCIGTLFSPYPKQPTDFIGTIMSNMPALMVTPSREVKYCAVTLNSKCGKH